MAFEFEFESTFAEEIEEAAGGEPILGVVIGGGGKVPPDKRGVVLGWEEARPYLNYRYPNYYGSPKCHPITAWTRSKVIVVAVHDGLTWVDSVPRHPVDHEPGFFGDY